MTKPCQKHLGAITRSQALLKSGLADVLEKRFHKEIQRDLILLGEVREMLFEVMANPTLPFTEIEPPLAEPMFDHINEVPEQPA